MRYTFLLLITSLLLFGCTATKINTTDTSRVIYLMRHAEKADDGTKNPSLTEKGTQRAEALAEQLKDENIRAIYSTNYKRTRETVAPLAEALDLDVIIYDPGDLKSLKEEIEKEYKYGETVVVVGHSSTTPTLVNLLISKEQFNKIDESDYRNLYKVEVQYDGFMKASNLRQPE
jgi:broad specificity phosphatase PhoE